MVSPRAYLAAANVNGFVCVLEVVEVIVERNRGCLGWSPLVYHFGHALKRRSVQHAVLESS